MKYFIICALTGAKREHSCPSFARQLAELLTASTGSRWFMVPAESYSY